MRPPPDLLVGSDIPSSGIWANPDDIRDFAGAIVRFLTASRRSSMDMRT
jgi:hypothetical protein